jgi:cytochrome c oxidase subunit 2
MASAVFLIVATFIVVGLVTGRKDNPGKLSDHRFILWGGVIVPFAILTVVAGLTVAFTRDLSSAGSGTPLHVEVTGHRWWWSVRYPDTGFTTANEMRVPTGRPIEVSVRAVDVIHSFWVPQVAGKTDAIPGQPNHMVFEVDKPGLYWGECAEFCGIQHTHMAIAVVALSPGDFATWQARHRTPPATTTKAARVGRSTFLHLSCAGCHTISGTSAHGTVGPQLTDLGERHSLGGGALPNTPANLREWLLHTQTVKPGSLMPTLDLTRRQVDQLASYLTTLK